MIKAADMLIARRADTRARADFATWKMMAKLNGASALPEEAQSFLASYKALLDQMSESEATDATINLIYRSYYAEMGGAGTPPDVRAGPNDHIADNVTASSGSRMLLLQPAGYVESTRSYCWSTWKSM